MARVLIATFALMLGGCVTFQVKEDHFFHPGPAARPASMTIAGAAVEPVEIVAGDGIRLGGAYVHQPGAALDVVYFGGNDSRVDDYGHVLGTTITRLGVNVLFVDYRGYGRSGGVPTIDALKSDSLAIFDYARRRAPGRPILVHGFSLGSFMAAYVATRRDVAGLILESSAPDVLTWARHQIPLYAKPFVRLKIAPALVGESNEQRLAAYTGPVLLITGDADPVTPPKFTHALAAASKSALKQVVIVPRATHGTVMASDVALPAYAAFLSAVRASANVAHNGAGDHHIESNAQQRIPPRRVR